MEFIEFIQRRIIMKEIMGTSRNIKFVLTDDNTLDCVVEAVITVSENAFSIDADGEPERCSKTETLRFGTTPDGIRQIAESMNRWADEAETAREMVLAGMTTART
jgi:hypothetical protein